MSKRRRAWPYLFGNGPQSIPNLALWLRSDQGITLNGSTVSQWNDLSGHGYNLSQATAGDQPVYVANGGPNGVPAVVFPGGLQSTALVGSGRLIAAQPLTVFIAARSSQNSPSSTAAMWDFATTFSFNSNTTVQSTGGLTVNQYDGTLGNGVTIVPAQDFNLLSYYSGASSKQILNNTSTGSGTNVGATAPGNNFTLGNNGNYPTTKTAWGGNIYEVIAYGGTLTTAQQTAIFTYLSNRYSSSFLPSNASASLKAWYRGDYVTTSSGSVTTWQDLSGNVNHLTQATSAKQPTTTTLAGKPAVAFSGSQWLDFTSTFTNGAAAAVIVLQLATVPGASTTYTAIAAKNSDNSFLIFDLLQGSGYKNVTLMQGCNSSASAATGYNPTLDTNVHAYVMSYAGGGINTPGNYTLYQDGASETLAASGNLGLVGTDLGAIGGVITNAPVQSNGFIGSIAEIMIYGAALSAGDITSLNAYLQARYGV